MHITSTKANVNQITMNNPDLTLPDGTVAETLDRFTLAQALIALGVEGITVNSGKIDALRAYRNHLEDIKEAAVNKFKSGDAA